jgi:hypothetical protein
MAAADVELFKSLPPGDGAFGGNYMKLQNFMSSSFGAAAMQMAESISPGMKAWSECFTGLKDMQIAGTFKIHAEVELAIVMKGLEIKQLGDCAAKASFKAATDPDNKFIAIEIPNAMGTVTQGYLKLANGALYTRQGFTISAAPQFAKVGRAELEADAAGFAKANAADDKKLQEMISKVDRSKTLWFAGSANNTPIADKVGDMWGSIDIDGGMAMDVTVQVKDGEMATKVVEGLAQAKKMANSLPPDLKGVIEGIDVSRDGDHLHGKIKMTEAQIKSLMSQMGGMGGMGMGH